MPALSPKAFELELRQTVDAFFDRPGLPDHPFGALLRRELPLEKLRDFWSGARMWEVNLLFNQLTLPTLLARCPDAEGRADLWQVIAPEFGNGDPARAHPTLARRFFQAIGIPDEALPLTIDLSDPLLQERCAVIERASFLEILTRFLAPETIGPKVFLAYSRALQAAYGMSDDDVEFYLYHGREDEADSAVLFRLVARYARTEEEQDLVRKVLRAYYDQDRIRALCVIRPLNFHFS